jgi:hypothetical protein
VHLFFWWTLTSNFRADVLEAAQLLHFLRFLQAGYRPSRLHDLTRVMVIPAHLATS